jgi:hypothetical protein
VVTAGGGSLTLSERPHEDDVKNEPADKAADSFSEVNARDLTHAPKYKRTVLNTG